MHESDTFDCLPTSFISNNDGIRFPSGVPGSAACRPYVLVVKPNGQSRPVRADNLDLRATNQVGSQPFAVPRTTVDLSTNVTYLDALAFVRSELGLNIEY